MAGWADPVIVANVNRTISDYYTAVDKRQANLVQDLVPKDPHKEPSWCKAPLSEHTASLETDSKTGPRIEAGLDIVEAVRNVESLPMGCPALPPNPPQDILKQYAARNRLQ